MVSSKRVRIWEKGGESMRSEVSFRRWRRGGEIVSEDVRGVVAGFWRLGGEGVVADGDWEGGGVVVMPDSWRTKSS